MAIPVKLEVFEGPLDLLLHLIDINKIDIYDIPIVTITEQYLEYIRAMDHEDMGVTSEFLVMAATLLDIKSRMLLPREVDENGEEEDPRDELVRRLLEYKLYKYMSQELRDRENVALLNFFREKHLPKEIADYEPPVDYDELIGGKTLAQLEDIFRDVLRRQETRIDPIRSSFGNIEREEIDLDAKQLYVHAYLKEHRRINFRALLEKQNSRQEIIVTFMVLLEMISNGQALVEQEGTFGEITISYKDGTEKPQTAQTTGES